jgi:hypothetical protein
VAADSAESSSPADGVSRISRQGRPARVVIHRLIGFWVIRRAIRILTADDPRPLRERLTREAKRILVGAAITLALLVVGVIVLIALLIALAS